MEDINHAIVTGLGKIECTKIINIKLKPF